MQENERNEEEENHFAAPPISFEFLGLRRGAFFFVGFFFFFFFKVFLFFGFFVFSSRVERGWLKEGTVFVGQGYNIPSFMCTLVSIDKQIGLIRIGVFFWVYSLVVLCQSCHHLISTPSSLSPCIHRKGLALVSKLLLTNALKIRCFGWERGHVCREPIGSPLRNYQGFPFYRWLHRPQIWVMNISKVVSRVYNIYMSTIHLCKCLLRA